MGLTLWACGSYEAPELREALLAMAETELSLQASASQSNMQESVLFSETVRIRGENTERFQELLETYGWPTPAMVGRDGIEAAWDLTEAGGIRVQRTALPLITASEDSGLADSIVAHLTDRVLVSQSKLQLYGTQTQFRRGRTRLAPFDQADSVQARRIRVGLSPLDQAILEAAADSSIE